MQEERESWGASEPPPASQAGCLSVLKLWLWVSVPAALVPLHLPRHTLPLALPCAVLLSQLFHFSVVLSRTQAIHALTLLEAPRSPALVHTAQLQHSLKP